MPSQAIVAYSIGFCLQLLILAKRSLFWQPFGIILQNYCHKFLIQKSDLAADSNKKAIEIKYPTRSTGEEYDIFLTTIIKKISYSKELLPKYQQLSSRHCGYQNIMSLNYLKNLPGSVKTLIRPMLWLSLSMHGLLLMLPIATETEAKSSPKKQESVKITQLPIPPSPKPPSVVPLPKPTNVIQQNPISSTLPQTKTLPTRLNPIIESPKPSSTIQNNSATPTPVAVIPTPTTVASPIAPTPTTVASPTPAPIPTTVASPTPTPTPFTATPIPTPNEIAEGVLNYENARRSCNGFCWQIKQTPFRTVSTTLKKRFEDQGYTVEKQEIADDIGRSVYTVSKDGKTQYLNVLSKVNGDAVYLLAEKELTPEEITQKTAL